MHTRVSPDHGVSSTVRRILLLFGLSAAAVVAMMAISASADAADACTTPECDSLVFVDSAARFTLYSDATVGSGVHRMYFGNPGDEPLFGDWDCDGVDTPAMYRRSTGYLYLRNSNSPGNADQKFFFGSPGDVPIAGDFNGNGCDTVSIYRPSEQRFYITNKLGGGVAEYSFGFGNPGDTPFVGDFDGDGRDTVGLHRVSTGRVYYTNGTSGGFADADFVFGDPGDIVFAGDWNGNGRDSVAAYRPSNGRVYLRFSNTAGAADSAFYVGAFKDAMPATGLPTYRGVTNNFTVDVEVYPGDDLERLARDMPEGTVFRLHGTITGQYVRPKDNQVFIGAAGAVMDGGGWQQFAFRSGARGVQIHGLEITNYNSPIQQGAVFADGDRWVIAANDIHHNVGAGVKVEADEATVVDNKIRYNGQLGLAVVYSTDTLVENNEIAYNNWERKHDWGWEAGATKFWSTNRLIVRGNWSHHNHGPGLWADHDNFNLLYEGNLVEDNAGPGIYHEISYDAVVRNNTLRRNGHDFSVWLWGGGITLSSSGGVEVYGNRLENNANGITMVQQNRGGGDRGSYTTHNNKVYDNVIINSGKTGAAEDIGNKAIFSSGNDFQGNTYIGDIRWDWDGRVMDWSSWRSYGLDKNGSWAR